MSIPIKLAEKTRSEKALENGSAHNIEQKPKIIYSYIFDRDKPRKNQPIGFMTDFQNSLL